MPTTQAVYTALTTEERRWLKLRAVEKDTSMSAILAELLRKHMKRVEKGRRK